MSREKCGASVSLSIAARANNRISARQRGRHRDKDHQSMVDGAARSTGNFWPRALPRRRRARDDESSKTEAFTMDRRTFLKTAAGATAMIGLATPAISQRAAARTLRLVPIADLANFDPVRNTSYTARHAGILVWDMLYGMDATLQPQRQMVES